MDWESGSVECPSCGSRLRISLDTPIGVTSLKSRRSRHVQPAPLEAEVLTRVAGGARDRDIAMSMKLSIDGVKRLVRSALVRLSAQNRTEAVVRAFLLGFIDLGEAEPIARPNERS